MGPISPPIRGWFRETVPWGAIQRGVRQAFSDRYVEGGRGPLENKKGTVFTFLVKQREKGLYTTFKRGVPVCNLIGGLNPLKKWGHTPLICLRTPYAV